MFKRIIVSPKELAKGEDIVNLQAYLNNDLQRFFATLFYSFGTGAESGVLLGFNVAMSGDNVNFEITPGIALQKLTFPLVIGDYPVEIMETAETLVYPAQPPVSGNPLRYDVLEIRAKTATVTNATRPFLQPSGGFSDQPTPKVATSPPEVRLRSGITGANAFDDGWLPLVVVTVTGTPASPVYTFTDVRPLFGAPGAPNGVAEISSPAFPSDPADLSSQGDRYLSLATKGVRFDGQNVFPGGGSIRLSTILEGGGVAPTLTGTYLVHLWIAKPEQAVYRPNLPQLILSTIGTDSDGLPSSPLTMRAPVDGLTTKYAQHLGAFLLTISTSGLSVFYESPGFRKVGNYTLLPYNIRYINSITSTPATGGRYTLTLSSVPKTASIVRIEVRVNLTASPTLANLGAFTRANTTQQLGTVELKNDLAISGSPVPPYGPPMILDLPVNHSNGGPSALLELRGDGDFQIAYRILGWIETTDGSYVLTG